MGHKAGKCLHSKVVCPISEMYKRNMDHTEMNLVYVINEPSTFHMTLKTIIMLNCAYFLYYNMNRSCFGYSSHNLSQERHVNLSGLCPSRCSIYPGIRSCLGRPKHDLFPNYYIVRVQCAHVL